jgi:NAD(P)H-dependent FMN reductase
VSQHDSAHRAELLGSIWSALAGDSALLRVIEFTGPDVVLPSIYDVTGFASAVVACANLAVAELLAVRDGTGSIPTVHVDRRSASAAFVSEQLFTPVGWEAPPVWDPIAGDYRARDRWIRLHTNYRHHRDAVLRVLGVDADRDLVAAAVATWDANALETAVVSEGGCAAVMYTREEWLAHPHGRAVADAPLIARDVSHPETSPHDVVRERPLAGIRVLDLTRVIAGPVCTRFLAAHGAQVLRVDPPGFVEVPALVPETTLGKRCAALDLGSHDGRERFERLVGEADVLVQGLRPGALDGLGFSVERLRSLNPSLVIASLDAYGRQGPWRDRRGFDSLVQMSSGIAAAGAAAIGRDEPKPLPAQALDHGTGYLLAAAVCRALTSRIVAGVTTTLHASLVATANFLVQFADPRGLENPAPRWNDADTEPRHTYWGAARGVPPPGDIAVAPAHWDIEAGPLGRDAATFGDEPRRRVLLVSGSLRRGSANSAALRTLASVAPADLDVSLYDRMSQLPHFDPDLDTEPLDAAVAGLRAQVAAADAVVFSTPEYAGALPGSFKNLLDWLVGGVEIYGKPVAWVNVSPLPDGAERTYASLRTVLGYIGAHVVEDACAHIGVPRDVIGDDGLVADAAIRAQLAAALRRLDAALQVEAGLH